LGIVLLLRLIGELLPISVVIELEVVFGLARAVPVLAATMARPPSILIPLGSNLLLVNEDALFSLLQELLLVLVLLLPASLLLLAVAGGDVLGRAVGIGLRVALAFVDLLMASPAEVLGTNVAIIGLGGVTVDRVCRVTLRTSNALALRKGESLTLAVHVDIVGVGVNAHDAELALAYQTVSHPLDLINILEVVLTYATLGLLVHVFDALDVFGVLVVRQVEQGQQDVERHDVFAPLGSFAHDEIDGYLLPILQLLLYGQGDLGLYAIDASLMPAQVRQDDTRLFLDVTDRAESIWNGNELRVPRFPLALLLHCFIELRVDGLDLVSLRLPGVFIDAVSDLRGQVVLMVVLGDHLCFSIICLQFSSIWVGIVVVWLLVVGLIIKAHRMFLRRALIDLRHILLILSIILFLTLDHQLIFFVVILTVLTQAVTLRSIDNPVNSWRHLLFNELPLKHLTVEQIGLIFEQVEDDVLSVALEELLREVAVDVVLRLAVWAEAQAALVLLLELQLLSTSQEEALAGELGDGMDEAYAMVEVVAIKEADELVGDQDVLSAELAVARHLFGPAWLELIVEGGHVIGLSLHFLQVRFWILNKKDEQLLILKIEVALVSGMNNEVALQVYLLHEQNLHMICTINVHDSLEPPLDKVDEV